MARRIAIFVAAVLAVLGIGVAVLLIWITSAAGASFLSTALKTTIKEKSDLEVTFSKIGFDLFPPRIRVEEISVRSEKPKIACTVEEAELAPSLIDLITKTLTIEEVYLGSPQCAVGLSQPDVEKLFFSKPSSQAPFKLDLSKLPPFEVFAITNASLTLDLVDPGRIGTIHAGLAGFGIDVTNHRPGMEVRGLLVELRGQWLKDGKKVSEVMQGVSFRAAVSDDAIDVRSLALSLAGGTLRLRDAHIPIPLWPKGPSVADLSLSMPLDVLNRLPLDLSPVVGHVAYAGQVAVQKEGSSKLGFTARGHLQLDQGRFGDFVIGDLTGDIALTPKGVAFSQMILKAADGTLDIDGTIAFDEALTSDIKVYLHGVELARLLEQVTFMGAYVTQKMTGPVHVKGQLNPLRLAGNVKINIKDHTVTTGPFRDPRVGRALYIPEGLVTGNVLVTDHFFEGQNLSAKAGRSQVAVNMRFNFDEASWTFDARSKDLYLEDIDKLLGMRVGGHGPVSCKIWGPLADPHIKGQGDFANAFLEEMHVDRAATELSFHDLTLTMEGLEAWRGVSHVSASELVFDFKAKGGLAINTKVQAEKASAEDLMAVFNIDGKPWGSPKGMLYGRVAINYNLAPEHLYVQAVVPHDGLEIFGEPFGPDTFRVDWNDGELVVNEFGVTKGKGTISVTGAVRADNSINFVGMVSGVETGSIEWKPVKTLGLDAVAQVFAVVEGTLDHPKGTIDVSLGRALHNGVRYAPSKLALAFDGFDVSGSGNLGGKKITVEHIVLNLKRDRFHIEGFVDDLDLVPIIGIDAYGKEAALEITGDLAVEGKIAARPEISGHAELMKVHARVNDLNFTNRQEMKVAVERSGFNIDRTRFQGPSVLFDLSGMIGLETLGLKVKGIADLKAASTLVDDIHKSVGELDFEVQVNGSTSQPSVRGSADVKNGMVQIDKFPYPIEGIRGHMTLSSTLIRFYDFKATSADGSLEMNGEIGLDGGTVRDYVFRLNASDLELAPFPELSFKASTTKNGVVLRSGQRGGIPYVTGDAEIKDLRYTQDIRVIDLSDLNVDRLSGTRTRPKSPKLIDRSDDFFSFDIRLHGSRNLEAHNNLFDVYLAIDDLEKPLRFIGTNQSYGFLGRVLGKRGQVRFAGRRFEIKHATLDFQDAEHPDNPNFQVIADGQIRDWNVTMTAEGSIEAYEITFTSQPYLPKEDIAYLILTGLTQAENRQFGGSGLSLGMPFIGQFAPGGGQLPVELQVYNEYSETAGTDTTRVAMGRWITQDIWVSISTGIGQTRDVEAQLDYKMNNDFSLSTGYEDKSEGSVGNVGLDLKFRLEF